MYSVSVLRSSDELESVRTFWENNVAHPNTDLDLFSVVVENRSEILRPHVLAVSDDDQIVSLLVGRIEEDYRRLTFGYLNLRIGKARSLIIVNGACIGRWNEEIAALISKELVDTLLRKEALLLTTHPIENNSFLMEAIRNELSPLRPRRFSSLNRHWKMNVPTAPEDFLKKLKSKQRNNIRRERRLFEDKYGQNSEFKCFTTEESVPALMDDIEHVASDSYHRRLGFGFFKNDETLKRMLLEARQGRLRTYVLYIDGISVAFWRGTAINDTLYLDTTAYDAHISDFKPGKLVLQYMLEDLATNSDIREVDFGFGDAYYKKQFGDTYWDEISVTVYGTSMRGLIFAALEIGTTKAQTCALFVLNRIGGVERVKRLWRKFGGARHRSEPASK